MELYSTIKNIKTASFPPRKIEGNSDHHIKRKSQAQRDRHYMFAFKCRIQVQKRKKRRKEEGSRRERERKEGGGRREGERLYGGLFAKKQYILGEMGKRGQEGAECDPCTFYRTG